MKQFEINVVRRDPKNEFKFKSVDKIEADDLIQLLTQFTFVMVRMQRDIGIEAIEELRKVTDDDIPF